MRSTDFMFSALGVAATLVAPTAAFWRMPCPGRLVAERIDPIISPGTTSGHVHTVSGGNGLGFTTEYDDLRASTCSSCPIKEDLSVYWSPQLYFMGENGDEFELVPQAGAGEGVTGGMTVYYEQRGGPNNDTLLAFPPGFRMVAGNPFQRTHLDVEAAPGNAVSFVCLDYAGESSQDVSMPNKTCPDGLRAQVYFPSCWNGELDSPDHSSHMAYPIGAYDNGACPESHPQHLISIFYEVIYQTNLFSDRWYSAEHPFVFAMGDTTGYGFHGDFINGWNHDYLKQAVENCLDLSGQISDCPVFDGGLFTDDESQACQVPPQINEFINGTQASPLTKLPGCNPVTGWGPNAYPPLTCDDTPLPGSYQTFFTNVIGSLGYEYAGCANDSMDVRTLQADFTWSDDMTVQQCVKYCKSNGYSLAGVEYGNQCYCDNNYSEADREPEASILGNCLMPCAGNGAQVCGGSSAMSVYKACDGGVCSNAVFVSPAGNDGGVTDSGSSGDANSVASSSASSMASSSSTTMVSSVVSSAAASSSSVASAVVSSDATSSSSAATSSVEAASASSIEASSASSAEASSASPASSSNAPGGYGGRMHHHPYVPSVVTDVATAVVTEVVYVTNYAAKRDAHVHHHANRHPHARR